MKQRKVWRYYCDHCGKGRCTRSAGEMHERHCIRNPDRGCRMCKHATGDEKCVPEPMPTLMEAFRTGGLAELRKVAEGCPACMLATIVQCRERDGGAYDFENEGNFDYKTEVASMWKEANAARAGMERQW